MSKWLAQVDSNTTKRLSKVERMLYVYSIDSIAMNVEKRFEGWKECATKYWPKSILENCKVVSLREQGLLCVLERTPSEYEAHEYEVCLRMKDHTESTVCGQVSYK